jgi:hypothetical protein
MRNNSHVHYRLHDRDSGRHNIDAVLNDDDGYNDTAGDTLRPL